jgi:hypothetical protein
LFASKVLAGCSRLAAEAGTMEWAAGVHHVDAKMAQWAA